MSPFDPLKKIMVIGDIFVDYHADLEQGLVRLGGVVHAARALNAINSNYSIAYIAPLYLHSSIQFTLKELNATYDCIGVVDGSPSVIVIKESAEAGDQGYTDILRDQKITKLNSENLKKLIENFTPSDILIFPGQYNIEEIWQHLIYSGAKLHIDAQYLSEFKIKENFKFETIFVSTSSKIFKDLNADPIQLRQEISYLVCNKLVFKENRGGCRVYIEDKVIHGMSFPTNTKHSVGVGDCFNCIWLSARDSEDTEKKLKRASYYASRYAETMSHEEFVDIIKTSISCDNTVSELKGIRIPWESRPSIKIYIAAPDFKDVDVTILDNLENSLKYHNFTPCRPIKINGIIDHNTSKSDSRAIYSKDIALLDECSFLIAVPLVDDPGTFTELGYFSYKDVNKKTILLDPTSRVTNSFVLNFVNYKCLTVSEAIEKIFELVKSND